MSRVKEVKPQTSAKAWPVAFSSLKHTFNLELLWKPIDMHSDGREFLYPVSFTIVVPI
jgi:hypothetical protein